MLRGSLRRVGLGALLISVLAVAAPGSAVPAGAASVATYVATFGYPDTQSFFPYGMAYDASDNTVIAGDYWNFRIQRYTANGAHVATYSNKAGAGVGAPYDIAIDPNDTSSCGSGGGQCSDFWVADQEQGDVRRVRPHRPRGAHARARRHRCLPPRPRLWRRPGHVPDPPRRRPVQRQPLHLGRALQERLGESSHSGTFIRAFDWSGWKHATGLFTPTPRGIGMDENGNIYVLQLEPARRSSSTSPVCGSATSRARTT